MINSLLTAPRAKSADIIQGNYVVCIVRDEGDSFFILQTYTPAEYIGLGLYDLRIPDGHEVRLLRLPEGGYNAN